MKIAIITINMYSKLLNFACPLHTYAFQQFLLKNGIDATVLNYHPVYYGKFNLRHPYHYYKKKADEFSKKKASSEEERLTIESKLKDYISYRDGWKDLYKEREIRYDKFQNFIDTNYIKTDFVYNSDLLEIMDPGFDCYICATDVIWKNHQSVGFDRGFFLACNAMENKWKIAYAASCGKTFSSGKEDEEQFLRYVNDFDFVSVREEKIKNYLDENTSMPITKVLDPVLLHDMDFYEKIMIKPKEERYLLLYYVIEEAKDTVAQAVNYARAHNLKIIEIMDMPIKEGRLTEYTDVDHEVRYAIGVEEWLGYIRHADCVFTNSFHCSCFSILFEKNLFVGHRDGDKVPHIMNTFGLGHRLIDDSTDLISQEPAPIDYVAVKKILEEKRAESADFILSAIKTAESQTKPVKDYSAYKKSLTYPVRYHSKEKGSSVSCGYAENSGEVALLSSGAYEYTPKDLMLTNDGTSHLLENKYSCKDRTFVGWNLRIKIDTRWFWYLEDGTLALKNTYNEDEMAPIRVFHDNETVPYIPVNRIRLMVAEAVWDGSSLYKAKLRAKKLVKKFLQKE